eukprot:5358062-Lingulodinium_polyedra.AAC.1
MYETDSSKAIDCMKLLQTSGRHLAATRRTPGRNRAEAGQKPSIKQSKCRQNTGITRAEGRHNWANDRQMQTECRQTI